MIIPEIKDYTPTDINYAKSVSSALTRYLKMLATSSTQPTNFEDELRLSRHNFWCQSALAVICDSATPKAVVNFWSQAADTTIKTAWIHSGAAHLPVALLAFGKLGSYELNLSSDIDLMFISSQPADAEVFKAIQKFIHLLTHVSSKGFCFRVDTDLRPGGRYSSLVSSINQMEDHYWMQGMTWERMALIRLRALAGPEDLVSDILARCHKFTFRKYLDFTLSDDLSLLRKEYAAPYCHPDDQGIQIKLCPGGIRDIELFIHSLQVTHGARRPQLKVSQTSLALDVLADLKILPLEQIDNLRTSYWFLRNLENHIQIANDSQTYWWPPSSLPSLASNANIHEQLYDHLTKTNDLVSQFLGQIENLQETLPDRLEVQQALLLALGYNANSVNTVWPEIMEMTALSLRSQKDEVIRRKFLFQFLKVLAKYGLDINLGIGLLKDFIHSTKAKASFFSLLTRKPKILKELALLFGCSPYLGTIVSSRPELIDSLIYRRQGDYSTNWDVLLEQLAESKLLNEILSANHLLATQELPPLFASFTNKAEEVVLVILRKLKEEFSVTDLDILTLGKWGGRELGLQSDLDFIFITKNPITENHHKIIKRFITRITEKHRGGQLYSIDLRLRPLGGAGALLVTQEILVNHLINKSQAWERQAYLKARPLEFTHFSPQSHIFERSSLLNKSDLSELKTIRYKLLKPRKAQDYDLKMNPGGLIDIELCLQTLLLANNIKPTGTSSLAFFSSLTSIPQANELTKLRIIYIFLRTLEQLHQLTSNQSSVTLSPSRVSFGRLCQLMKTTPHLLATRLDSSLTSGQKIIAAINPALIR